MALKGVVEDLAERAIDSAGIPRKGDTDSTTHDQMRRT